MNVHPNGSHISNLGGIREGNRSRPLRYSIILWNRKFFQALNKVRQFYCNRRSIPIPMLDFDDLSFKIIGPK